MTLKKLLLPLIILIFWACSAKKTSDPVMEQRLAGFIKAKDDMKPEKMMDYIYPKLFTIVSRDQVQATMKHLFFEDKDLKVGFDSLQIEKIFPIFEMDSARYAKVTYTMVTTLEYSALRDSIANKHIPVETGKINHTITTDRYPAPQLTLMQTLLAREYGTENVTADPTTGIIKIRSKNIIIAIKDNFAGEWSFFDPAIEGPAAGQLFDKAVLDNLATYK